MLDLTKDWIDLMENCRLLTAKDFNNRQRSISDRYKRMSLEDQGRYHMEIAADHYRWAVENGVKPSL